MREPARPLNSEGAIIRKHIPMCLDVIHNTREARQSNMRKRLGKKIDTDVLHRHRNQLNKIRKGLEKGKIEDAAHWIQTCIEDATKPGPERRQAKPWFDQECYHRQKETLAKLHKTRQSKSLENIDEYRQSRSQYKQLVIKKIKAYIERIQEAIIEEAETDPYKAIRHRQQRFQPSISMDTWEAHIIRITCAKESRPTVTQPDKTEPLVHISGVKGIKATKEAGRNRARGPDGIRNEHIKETMTLLLPTWTTLLNKCLELGKIPSEWKKSTIKLTYKGKGGTHATPMRTEE